MLKKTIVGFMLCVSMGMSGLVASAAINEMYNTLNDKNGAEGWGNAATVQTVQTDLVPSGWAVTNNAEGNIWISNDVSCDLVNNVYYLSYYFNLDGEMTTSATNNFGAGLYETTSNAAKGGILYNGDYSGYSPFVKIGESATKRPINRELLIGKGKTYQAVIKIEKGTTNPGIIMDVYDVEAGTLFATTETASSADITTATKVKLGGTGWGGTQYISDFMLKEISDSAEDETDNNDKQNAKNVFLDARNVTFEGIPSVIEADKIDFPETTTGAKGSTITYTTSDSSVIDENGNVNRDITDRRTFVKAVIENNGISMERTFAVTVKGTGTTAVANENWGEAGEQLSEEYAPKENGFTGAWKSGIGLTENSELGFDTFAGNKMVALSGISLIDTNDNVAIYNGLNKAINMDKDITYYAQWNMKLDTKSIAAEEQVRFAKVGFIKDGTSNNEISFVAMMRTADSCTPDIGLKANTSTTYAEAKTINPGGLYNVLMKIDANETGNDNLYVKVWLCGTQEPETWTYTKSAEMTGRYSKIFAQTNEREGYGAYFGNFIMEAYTDNTADVAESNVAVYINSGTELPEIIWPLENSIAEHSYMNMVKLRDNAYVSDVILMSNEKRISNIADINGDVTVNAVVSNDAGKENELKDKVYVAIYDNMGKMTDVKVAETDKVATDTSIDATVTFENFDGAEIRVFVWNGMTPYMNDVVIDNAVRNY